MKISDLYGPKEDARYTRNQQRGHDPCNICGRPLKDRVYYVVEDFKTGDLLPVSVDPDPHGKDQSYVYIGSECAKRAELKPYVRKD